MGFAYRKEIKLVVYFPQYDQILIVEDRLIFAYVEDGGPYTHLVQCTIGRFKEIVKKNHGVILGEL